MRPLMVKFQSIFCLFGGRITSVGWETANSAAVSDQERDLAIVPSQHIKLCIPSSSQRRESSVLTWKSRVYSRMFLQFRVTEGVFARVACGPGCAPGSPFWCLVAFSPPSAWPTRCKFYSLSWPSGNGEIGRFLGAWPDGATGESLGAIWITSCLSP